MHKFPEPYAYLRIYSLNFTHNDAYTPPKTIPISTHMDPCQVPHPCHSAEGSWPHRRWLADNYSFPAHNHHRSRSSHHRPGTSSLRRFANASSQKRPKPPVTPYPGIFCRELLCFLYFAAQPSLQPQENKDFASKVWVGVGARSLTCKQVSR